MTEEVKKLKHIINWTIWSLMALYVLVLVLIHLPSTQRFIGRQVSETLSEVLGTDVSIDRVELGFLNRIILDNVTMLDQENKEMLRVGRLSAKIDLLPLVNGKISISSAQLFGAHAQFYKADSLAIPNYQFVLDSLSSNDSTSNSALNLRINSLIIRHSSVSYDQYDIPETPEQFNLKHWKLNDISAHAIVKSLHEDSINVNIKRLAFNEKAGLKVNRLSLWVEANPNHARLKDFRLQTPGSDIGIDSIHATYDKDRFEDTFRYQAFVNVPRLSAKDFACFLPSLNAFTQQFAVKTEVNGSLNDISCKYLTVSSDDQSLEIQARGDISNLRQQPLWSVKASHIDVSS